MKWTMRDLLFSLALLMGALVCNVSSSFAQLKLEPLPIYDQCASLSAAATPPGNVKQALSLLKDKDPKQRVQAAQQLSKACHSQAIDPLIALLTDPDVPVRVAAIEALGKLGATEAVEPLRELAFIHDKDLRISYALISALASFKLFSTRNTVLNVIAHPNGVDIADEADLRMRCVAILTLNQLTDVIHSRKGILFLSDFQRSQHATTRQIAEQAMLALKETRNGPSELVALLKEHNPEYRIWAAYWLGKLCIERGRAQLEEVAANDPHPGVKREAAQALAALKAAGK